MKARAYNNLGYAYHELGDYVATLGTAFSKR